MHVVSVWGGCRLGKEGVMEKRTDKKVNTLHLLQRQIKLCGYSKVCARVFEANINWSTTHFVHVQMSDHMVVCSFK